MPKPVAVLIAEPLRSAVLPHATMERIQQFADIVLPGEGPITPDVALAMLGESIACITSWGSPQISEDLLNDASQLKMVAHAAGSVRPIISDALWDRKIRVTSASAALAVDVAWTTVALMVLGLKNVFRLREELRKGEWHECSSGRPRELYGNTVGLIGASHVGRNVIRLLSTYETNILLFDPFVSHDQANELGVEKCERLEDLLKRSDVVSVHAPAIPETRHMLHADNIPLIRHGAVLINTARGSLIDEGALVEELKRGRIFACIDVTDPEPPAPDHPFRTLPNVLLMPHLAGSVQEGRARMGAYAVEEIRRFLSGEPLKYEVTREMMPRIA